MKVGVDVYICRFWTRFHSDECVAGTKRTFSLRERRLLSTDTFLRSEAVIYFRFMTLHFTQTYSSLWFPFGKPRLGWAAPATVVTVAVQPFCVIKYSPLFCPPQAASLPAKPVISVFYREDGRGCVYMPLLDRKNASVLGKRTSQREEVRLVPATHSSERERVRSWHILPPHDRPLSHKPTQAPYFPRTSSQ